MYVGRYQPFMTMPLNSCGLGLDVTIVVGEDKGANRTFVINGKDAAPSLLASSPRGDSIRAKR